MKLSQFTKRGALATIAGLSIISFAGFVSAQTSTQTSSTQSSQKGGRSRSAGSGGISFTAIKTAITNNDYSAFLSAVAQAKAALPVDAPALPTITQAQFNTIVQAEKLRVSGDHTGAMKLLTDAGITFPGFGGMHKGMGHMMANLTPSQQTAMSQAHDLRQSGKQSEADALLKAAGITMPAKGMHKGNDAKHAAFLSTLTDAQKATLTQSMTLRKSGDTRGADALLKSANITLPAPPDHTGIMGHSRHGAAAVTVTQ